MQLDRLQRELGYQFTQLDHLKEALTHRSAGAKNNERLEFLGDSILNFAIGNALYEKFPKANEGELSRMRAALVKEHTLAIVAKRFSLGDYMKLGAGELKSGGFRRESILSDCLEAIIAAIYLDGGLEKALDKIPQWYGDLLEQMDVAEAPKDAKTRLQEYLQGRRLKLPEYEVLNIEGDAHNQRFTVTCRIQATSQAFIGSGSSRRKAEQDAANQVLLWLNSKQQ